MPQSSHSHPGVPASASATSVHSLSAQMSVQPAVGAGGMMMVTQSPSNYVLVPASSSQTQLNGSNSTQPQFFTPYSVMSSSSQPGPQFITFNGQTLLYSQQPAANQPVLLRTSAAPVASGQHILIQSSNSGFMSSGSQPPVSASPSNNNNGNNNNSNGGAAGPKSRRLCRHFSKGRCTWGEGCRFSHDPALVAAEAAAEAQQQQQQQHMLLTAVLGGSATVDASGGNGAPYSLYMAQPSPAPTSAAVLFHAHQQQQQQMATLHLQSQDIHNMGRIASIGSSPPSNTNPSPQRNNVQLIGYTQAHSTTAVRQAVLQEAVHARFLISAAPKPASGSAHRRYAYVTLKADIIVPMLLRLYGPTRSVCTRTDNGGSASPDSVLMEELTEVEVREALTALVGDEASGMSGVRDVASLMGGGEDNCDDDPSEMQLSHGGMMGAPSEDVQRRRRLMYLVGSGSLFWSALRWWHTRGTTECAVWDQRLTNALAQAQKLASTQRSPQATPPQLSPAPTQTMLLLPLSPSGHDHNMGRGMPMEQPTPSTMAMYHAQQQQQQDSKNNSSATLLVPAVTAAGGHGGNFSGASLGVMSSSQSIGVIGGDWQRRGTQRPELSPSASVQNTNSLVGTSSSGLNGSTSKAPGNGYFSPASAGQEASAPADSAAPQGQHLLGALMDDLNDGSHAAN